jgi:oxaloacetate decarboxylase alpha subunit
VNEIRFVDTTVRDGQQSLWALNMKTGAMLAIAEQMDQCGFEGMEFFVTVMIKKYVREHKENPWDWLRLGSAKFTRTRLRYHGGLHAAFEKVPSCVLRIMIERAVTYGLTLTRTSNCWNDYDDFRGEVEAMRQIGMETVANLIYSVSPRHTDAYYAVKAREVAALRPYRICFKDVGGLLTPERARALLPLILENAGDVPVEFHAHCNNGLAPICYLEAAKLGIKTLHTAIPPLANGSAQPSVFNVAKNLRTLGYTPCFDEDAAAPVREHFMSVARSANLPVGSPVAYDQSVYTHQVPGGMISNLRHQLKLVGLEDKVEAALEEAARVRAEFGYPIMVTPLSQFVGSQAAINVVVGERYKEVTDQVIQYALGIWGKEAPGLMDANVKDRILSRPRAREWDGWQPPDPSIDRVRSQFGGAGVSDEELVLRVFAGTDEVKAMLAAGAPKPYLDGDQSLVTLIEELAKKTYWNHIDIRKPGLLLRLDRKRPPSGSAD